METENKEEIIYRREEDKKDILSTLKKENQILESELISLRNKQKEKKEIKELEDKNSFLREEIERLKHPFRSRIKRRLNKIISHSV